jgi:DNA-directed RNA polymerase specialized sigma24 family protein
LTSFRDALRSSRIFVFQEMTISLAVPDILVARAKTGDLEALEALYRAFETPVYNLALRMLRQPEEAEDVLQETFLEVVKSIKQYRGEGYLWGWVRQIAVSKALMRIRKGQLRDTDELHEERVPGGTGLGAGGLPVRIDLERAFERLTPTSRAVVWLHDVEGYTHEEIAERMERTVSFSKSQLARAHARLRRLLEEGGEAQ